MQISKKNQRVYQFLNRVTENNVYTVNELRPVTCLIDELKTCLETVRVVYWHKYIWSIIHVILVGKGYIKL